MYTSLRSGSTAMPESMSEMKVGIVCHEEALPHMQDVLRSFPAAVPLFQTYRHFEQAVETASRLADRAEAMLFSESAVYTAAKKHIRFQVPANGVALSGASFLSALYKAERKYSGFGLSVDSITKRHAEKVRHELGEQSRPFYYCDEQLLESTVKAADFHYRLFVSGKTGMALTGMKSVADELTRLGVPNEWISPSEQDVTGSLSSLISAAGRHHPQSQIVIGIVKLGPEEPGRSILEGGDAVRRLRENDIRRVLASFAESLEGDFTRLSEHEFMFVTLRYPFERETEGCRKIPLAKELEKRFGLAINVGIGFGLSARHAGEHARMALRHSLQAGPGTGFIVREDRGVMGPLEMTEPPKMDLSLISPDRLRRAERAGMSAAYLSKLMVDVNRYGKTRYTADELAGLLGVTLRTAHRLLVIWTDERMAQIVGEERTVGKGRPKQVFNLNFIAEMAKGVVSA